MKGITIDIDQTGQYAVIVPAVHVDKAFIEFVQSDDYLDWLEEAHAGEVDFPYLEPLLINGKEYDLPIYRIKQHDFSLIGSELTYDESHVVEQLKA